MGSWGPWPHPGRSPRFLPQALALPTGPSWEVRFLLGFEAFWPYKAVCGHLLEKLRALTPHPAPSSMRTRAQPGKDRGRGGPAGTMVLWGRRAQAGQTPGAEAQGP